MGPGGGVLVFISVRGRIINCGLTGVTGASTASLKYAK